MEFQKPIPIQAKIKLDDHVYTITWSPEESPHYTVAAESGDSNDFWVPHLNTIANMHDFERGRRYIPHEALYMAQKMQRDFQKFQGRDVEIVWFSHNHPPGEPTSERQRVY